MNRRWAWGLTGVVALAAGALAVPACSSDDGVPTGGSTPDATTPDVVGSDVVTTPDSPTADAPSNNDASQVSDAGDAGASTCTVFDAAGLDDASVAAGFQAVWKVYRCYGCHQKASQTVDDAGNGIVLSGNNDGLGDSGTIFPPNLTNDPTTGLGCWTNAQIQSAILDGMDNEGGALCPPMPKFGHPSLLPDGGSRFGFPMDAGVAQQIIDFLRSLPPVVNQVPETTCPPAADAGTSDSGSPDGATSSDAASDASGD
jgi:hypothetical protein